MTSQLSRLRGAALALSALALAAGAFWWLEGGGAPEPQASDAAAALFRFEKEDLESVLITRPADAIGLRRVDGVWRVDGQSWRPSASMVRRVAHQLHDLDARAEVVRGPDDFARYGLGPGAITVELGLADGRSLAFAVGDPNPTSVSWYLRPLPGDTVYVVKKSAVDAYRAELDAFRERKFAQFDADAADALESHIEGRTLVFRRTSETAWEMTEPEAWSASRDEVRMMLGRISAMRALDFVEDAPADPARYGLGPGGDRVRVGVAGAPDIEVRLGAVVPGADPPQRYVLHEDDQAVYAVRAGFQESFGKPVEAYRNPVIIGRHEWEVTRMRVTKRGTPPLELTRTSDGWRWPDGGPVPGATPRRVATRAADLRALAFHDDPEPLGATDLDPPAVEVRLVFEDDAEATARLGRAVDGPEERVLAAVDGDPVVYEVDGQLHSVVEDLFREYGRKQERDAQRHIRSEEPG